VPEPITVTISHSLGRDEARRRLDQNLGYVRAQPPAFVSSTGYDWTGYRLDFRLAAMGQSIKGFTEVEDCLVHIELGLPPLLHILSKLIIARISGECARVLRKPGG
jgi:Putative polyhydroxyalkanoic acid system protein (PHA_gran_rgn)